MVGWIILGILVGLIVLILLIPVGVDIRYEDEIVRVSAKAAGIKIQLIPKKKRKAKEKKPEEEKPKTETEEPKAEGGKKRKRAISLNAEEILELLKTVLRSFGRFGRKFRVERFVLHWIAAGGASYSDPYRLARVFGVVNAGLSQLAPICSERFHCRDSSVWTDLDFVREDHFFEFGLTTTIRIGQILGTGIAIAFGALKILLRSRRRVKREAKEESLALERWLADHPEEAERYRLMQKEESAAEAENAAQEEKNPPTEENAVEAKSA